MVTEYTDIKKIIKWILVVGLLMELVALIITRNRIAVTIGIAVGILVAIFNIYNIKSTFETAFLLPAEKAKKYYFSRYFLRMVIAFIIFFIMLNISLTSLIGSFVGMQSIKLATYASVLLEKQKINHEGGEQESE